MKRVLIVDDQSLIRNVLRLILEQQGYECLEAENGQQAWEWLFEPLTIDLIVTDNHMPVMSGLQLIKKIKSINNLKHLPIVLFSGALTEALQREAQENGANAVLAKPLNFPDLVQVVSQIVCQDRDGVERKERRDSMPARYCGIH